MSSPNPVQHINIPDELRPDHQPETEVPRRDVGPVIAALVSIMLVVLGAAMIGVGVGTWLHPGAGLAASGLVVVVFGVLLGYRS